MFPYAGRSRRVLLPVAHKVAYARAYESPFRLHVVANKGAANKGAFGSACRPVQPEPVRSRVHMLCPAGRQGGVLVPIADQEPSDAYQVANHPFANALLDAPSPLYPRSPCRRLDCCAAVWFLCTR